MVRMINKIYIFAKKIIFLYSGKRIPQAAAAMSYFFTMTVFPVIICLYTLLGNNFELAMRVLDFLGRFVADETASFLQGFIEYVADNYSIAMMVAGLTVILTSSSAALRTVQNVIGDMQGGRHYQGVRNYLNSIIFSFVFVAALYFGIMVMVTGSELLDFIDNKLPIIDISRSWVWLRFVLFFGIEFVIIWGVYYISKRSYDKYRTFPGALLAAVALVAISLFFSAFISASVKYQLVYGSLASIILLMFWLYTCSVAILCGAAFNIVLHDMKTSG